ncbi:MAG TPA: lysylphosphatidylglycerol synthase transmembrane domain-containing protein [Stellaceae bacterium]|nr:lysylphosphatidylglycerol synthase transmembrane domain-containing protein [Stellaceae bacterium]
MLSKARAHLPKIIFSLALLGLALSRVSAQRLWEAAHQLSLVTFLLCLGLGTAQVFIASWRWHLMLRAVGVHLRLATTFKVNIVSLLANTLMINVVGGALTRIYLLSKMAVPSPPVLSTTALEKVLATAVLAVMSLAGLSVLHPQLVPHLPSYAGRAGVTILLLMLGGAAFGARSQRGRHWVRAALRYLRAVLESARAFLVNGRALAVAVFLTILSQLVIVLIGVALTASLWAGASPLNVMLVLPATMLLAGLPISVGGWGVREFSTMVALGLLGASPDIGLLVSLLIYASTLGGIVVAAALMLPVHLNRRAEAGAL